MSTIDFNKIKKTAKDVANQSLEIAAQVKDVTVDAYNSAQKNVKEFSDKAKDKFIEVEHNAERAFLFPITLEEIQRDDYMPVMVKITSDNLYREKEVFTDAIGYETHPNGLIVLNIYSDCIEKTGYSFYPNSSADLYYVDPYDKHHFINMNLYFDYTKKARVDELVKIAHDLGAKRCEIKLKEEQKTFVSKNKSVKAKNNISVSADANASIVSNNIQYSSIHLEDRSEFEGNDNPIKPELIYFKNEEDINSLINMRLNDHNPIVTKTYSIKYNCNSGIKSSDAVKIDGALRRWKLCANASISSEVEREDRLVLEYTIEF